MGFFLMSHIAMTRKMEAVTTFSGKE